MGKRKNENKSTRKSDLLRTGETLKNDGSYMYRYSMDGKRYTIWAKSLSELRKKEEEVKRNVTDGIRIGAASQITLNDAFEMYLSTKAKIRPTTAEIYRRTWGYSVKESHLGTMAINQINHFNVQQFINNAGYAKNTGLCIIRLIKSTFKFCVKNNYIRSNPAEDVEIPGEVKVKLPLTLEEQQKMLKFAEESNVYNVHVPWITFALETGVRISELCGLTWSDIDFEKKIVHVRRQLQYRAIPGGEWHYMITDTKTQAGVRDIPLTPKAVKALKDWKEICVRLGRRCTVDPAKIDGAKSEGITDFVFFTQKGFPYVVTNCNQFLERICEKYNKTNEDKLPIVTCHILRHTAATRMFERGLDPKAIQKIMGHKNMDVTMNVYVDPGEDFVAKEMEKMAVNE